MKRKKKAKPGAINYRELARLTGADRASIKKWGPYRDEAHALEVINERKKKAPVAANHPPSPPGSAPTSPVADGARLELDPETGLTWFAAKEREQALKLRRANEIAEKEKSREWMSTQVHHEVISVVMNQLEQLPGKAASQLGLDVRQSRMIQRMIDDIRLAAAEEVAGL